MARASGNRSGRAMVYHLVCSSCLRSFTVERKGFLKTLLDGRCEQCRGRVMMHRR